MKLLLILKSHIGVYHNRALEAVYEVDWSAEPEPLELVKELLQFHEGGAS